MAFASELKRKEIAAWWTNPDTFATSLLALAIDEFGTEFLAWEPETIRLEIESLYSVDIPQLNMDKLLALVTVLTTDVFYRSVESFMYIANALNGSQANFQQWDPVETDEAAWAVTEVYLNDPPPPRTNLEDLYAEDVRRYLGVILEDDGIVTQPPDVLDIAIKSPSFQDEGSTFADDPVLFQGFQRLSQQKSTQATQYAKSRMNNLVDELNRLPLQNRDNKRWSQFVARTKQTK